MLTRLSDIPGATCEMRKGEVRGRERLDEDYCAHLR